MEEITQVEIFTSTDLTDLKLEVNSWIKRNFKKCSIIEIKLGFDTRGTVAMIIYKIFIEESEMDKEIV